MGNSYTFTTGGNIQSGSIIRAEDFTTEFNALQGAFDSSSGHKHNGDAGEGGRIEVVGPAGQLVVTSSALTGSSSKLLNLGTSSNLLLDVFIADDKKVNFGDGQDATIKYDETTSDTLLFEGANIRINNTNKIIEFRDADLKIHSSTNGQLDIDADVELEIVAPTVDIQAETAITLVSDAITFGENGDTDVVLSFNGNSNNGELKWMEDEDYFEFTDSILIATNGKLQFRDTGLYIDSTQDGQLNIVSDGIAAISSTGTGANAILFNSAGGVTLDADSATHGVRFSDNATDYLKVTSSSSDSVFTILTDSKDIIFNQFDGNEVVRIADDRRLYFFDKGGEYISSDGDDLTIAAGTDIKLSASNIKLTTDGAILGFGNDNEVTLTHVHNTGLILGGTTPTLTIGDAGEEDAKIVFDGNAQDFYIGLDDSEDDLVIGKGSALGTTPAISIDENVLVAIADDLTLKSDSAILGFGQDTDTTLTHVADTGLLLNSTRELQFGSSSTKVHQSSSGVLDLTATTVRVSNDLHLNTDSSVLGFGEHNDITITHVADTGLTITSTNATNAAGPVLSLVRDSVSPGDDDNVASLLFKADSDTGAQVNAFQLTAQMKDVSNGTEDSEIIISNIVDGNETPQLTISATGVTAHVGFTHSGDLTVGDDLVLNSDSALISLGDGADATITHDGTTGVTIAANPITIDSGGDIILDADDADIIFKDGGTSIGSFTNSSSDFVITSSVQDKDILFKGDDNGSPITALTLDMSEAGKATFNQDVNVPGEVQTTKIAFTDGDDAMTVLDGGSVTFADDVKVSGRATPGTPSAASGTSGAVTFDLSANNNFTLTVSGAITSLGFANQDASSVGQSGTIKLVLGSAYAITPAATIAINADTLTAIQAAGTYMLTYFVTDSSGNDSIFITSSGALT